jgi:hypothetical protein
MGYSGKEEDLRLWSLHPKYLDAKGLVALWREALLAQAVLAGETRGYKNHPQLFRFRACESPLGAIADFLRVVEQEARHRGYSFNAQKIGTSRTQTTILVTSGQVVYEWGHLKAKLARRDPARLKILGQLEFPDMHPLFVLRDGEIESWEILPTGLR